MRAKIVEIGSRDGYYSRTDLMGMVGEWEQEAVQSLDDWKSGYMRFDDSIDDMTCWYFIQVKVAPLDTEKHVGLDEAIEEQMDTMKTGTPEEYIGPCETISEYSRTIKTESIDRHGHPDFYKILDELRNLHSRKNRDYSGNDPLSNLRMCERGGIPAWKGVIVRLTDKISRLLSFMQRESYEVKDESLEDTLRDAAIYSILAIILYRESR